MVCFIYILLYTAFSSRVHSSYETRQKPLIKIAGTSSCIKLNEPRTLIFLSIFHWTFVHAVDDDDMVRKVLTPKRLVSIHNSHRYYPMLLSSYHPAKLIMHICQQTEKQDNSKTRGKVEEWSEVIWLATPAYFHTPSTLISHYISIEFSSHLYMVIIIAMSQTTHSFFVRYVMSSSASSLCKS